VNLPLNISVNTIPIWILFIVGFALAFGITFRSIPVIVRVSRLKNLCAVPNKRTSHSNAVPNLGGVAIFIGFIISTIITAGEFFTSELFYIIVALIILFFIGMKDDILIIDPKKKFTAQILVGLIIVILADIKIVNFFEIFNIGSLSYLSSILLTVFMFLLVINGFNLIDGIDGLASGVGILVSLVFGAWFWSINSIEYAIMCFALAGSLIAFFIFNVFGKKNKIFLGDTGSMLVGLTIGIIVVQFLRLNLIAGPDMNIQSSPAFVISILILPLFDTLRVFVIRIHQGKSPFVADRQHIHHRMLELGFTHLQSTIILIAVNGFFIIFTYSFQQLGNIPLMLILLAMATIMSFILLRLAKKRTRRLLEIEFYRLHNLEKIKRNKDVLIRQIRRIEIPNPHRVEVNSN
jgi:UDP-N-acetylmuramyl pentapeptide phosphotransferase/UDP-N-acetylglucosamine-1-phosphate transferase